MVEFRWCILGKFNPRPGTAVGALLAPRLNSSRSHYRCILSFWSMKHVSQKILGNSGKIWENDMFSSKLYVLQGLFISLASLVTQGGWFERELRQLSGLKIQPWFVLEVTSCLSTMTSKALSVVVFRKVTLSKSHHKDSWRTFFCVVMHHMLIAWQTHGWNCHEHQVICRLVIRIPTSILVRESLAQCTQFWRHPRNDISAPKTKWAWNFQYLNSDYKSTNKFLWRAFPAIDFE